MERFYKKFVNETIDNSGKLTDISYIIPENFNYAFDVLDELAKIRPNDRAMVWIGSDGEERTFTFSEMSRLSSQAANFFKRNGIKKGDRVMLVLKRHFTFWIAIMGLNKIGAVVVPATHLLMKKDFVYRFNAAGITGIVCTPDDGVYKQAEEAFEECPFVTFRAIIKEKIDGWQCFLKSVLEESDVFERPADISKDDRMIMYFTSGTTGYPKIATHDNTYALGHLTTGVWWHNLKPGDLHLTIADTGWGKAVWGKLYGQWLAEACVFTYDFNRFHSNEILPMFAKYGITSFCAPPTMYRFFIKEDLSKYDLSSLKYATVAGEALNPEVFKQFYDATGLKLMEGFGQTETTLTVANLPGMEPKPGSMGKPNPQYNIRLVNDDGEDVPMGASGEICVDISKGRPIGLFKEYFRDEEKTNEAMHDGLYHTGDMAWRDEDGYLWYISRKDDMIKSSGYRIGPFEIESVIMELPYVLECAVTGVPDTEGERGQLVKATIVLVPGKKEPSDALKKEIQDYVKHATAPYKYPRVVEFVEALPKTISGKVRRVEIRKEEK